MRSPRLLVLFAFSALGILPGCFQFQPSGKITGLTKAADSALLSESVPSPGSSSTPVEGCACTFEIESSLASFDGAARGAKPGDVICLKPGNRAQLTLTHLQGSLEAPIVVKNCGGAVIIDQAPIANGILVKNSAFFRITGTGEPSIDYGIAVKKATATGVRTSGIELTNLTTEFEIDHVEITGVKYGIYGRTPPDGFPCLAGMDTFGKIVDHGNGEFSGGLNRVRVHDTWVHDVTQKGMFFASQGCGSLQVTCNGATKSVPWDTLNNADIHHNVVERTGYQLIQMGCGRNNKLHHNRTGSHGLDYLTNDAAIYETSGFNFQGDGEIYANFMNSTEGLGNPMAFKNVRGATLVYDNVIRANPEKTNGTIFFAQSMASASAGALPPMIFANNTVMNADRFAAFSLKEDALDLSKPAVGYPVAFKNNLIVNIKDTNVKLEGNFNKDLATGASRNFLTRESDGIFESEADVLFTNPESMDYTLQKASPAIDQGTASFGFSLTVDHAGQPRISGGKVDYGAFERPSD